jgi:peptidoglycan/xylan/chitin deacetylase (PgdA/CDA1 family)
VNADERGSARLLFADHLATGAIDIEELNRPEVARAVRARRVPPFPVRILDRLAIKANLRGYERDCVEPFVAARRAVLGPHAAGPPRVLIRVDEFPHAMAFEDPERFDTATFERFHAVMTDAGVDYLIAALPRLSQRPYDPDASGGRGLDEAERDMLRRLHAEGVEVALHGLDHRTRDTRPRRHSELLGLKPAELERRLDTAHAVLADLGIEPRVFVPPFNRFSRSQYPLLARRYEVVCGGPESVLEMGFHRTPLWREGAVYMPAYHPLYGRAREVRQTIERLIEQEAAVWVPVVLHWGWELGDDFGELGRFAERVAPYATSWSELLDAARLPAGQGVSRGGRNHEGP